MEAILHLETEGVSTPFISVMMFVLQEALGLLTI